MFIAHAPAGYLLARAWYSRPGKASWRLFLLLITASVAPDVDLLYFYCVDNRAHNHHDYWTHIPAYWLGIYYIVTIACILTNKLRIIPYATAMLLGVMLHLVLDTVTGGVQWGYPLTNQYFTLVAVPAVYDWWVLNFILHWTFLLELILVGLAGFQLFRNTVAKRRLAFSV